MNTIAKTLRKRPTDTEKVLWRHLRAKQMEGHKFRRQEPIGKYNEVLTNIEGVLEVIRENCLSHPPLTPPLQKIPSPLSSPLKGGEDMVGVREGKLPTRNEKEPK